MRWWIGGAIVLAVVVAGGLLLHRRRAAAPWPRGIGPDAATRQSCAEHDGNMRREFLHFRFGLAERMEGWEVGEDAQRLGVDAGCLLLRTKSRMARIFRPLDIQADEVSHLSLVMAVSRGRLAELRWQVAGRKEGEEYWLEFPVRSDGFLHYYEVRLADNPGWRGRVAWVALRPSDRPARVAVGDLQLVQECRPVADGTMRATRLPVTVGQESRPGVIAPAPSRLRWVATVPSAPSVMHIGYAVASEAWEKKSDGVGFVVSAEEGGRQRALLSAFLRPSAEPGQRRWWDQEIDMRPFAGGAVTLVFETVGGDPGASASASDTAYDWAVWSLPRIGVRTGRMDRPNVVILLLDALRADHVGCYGYSVPTSPNIDGLAAQGIRFGNAMSQSSWTSPSVASLFTSLYPHEAAPAQNVLDPPPGAVTMAEVLGAAGYSTGMVSSSQYLIVPSLGYGRGAHQFLTTGLDAADCAQGVTTWLDRYAREPFFLYVHCWDPHDPYDPPSPFREPFVRDLHTDLRWVREGQVGGTRRNPEKEVTEEDVAYLRGLYDGNIAYADHYVGKIVRELERRGLRRRTIIIVTADHGEEFMEHGGLRHARTLYQEVLHVPLVIVFPDGRGGGQVVKQAVRLLDVAPTVLDFAGATVPGNMRGKSLRAALQGTWVEEPCVAELAELFGEWSERKGVRLSWRQGNQKLITWADGRWEAYDLAADPREQRPLRDNQPPAAAAEALARLRESIRGSVSPARKAMNPEALEAMRTLGYVR